MALGNNRSRWRSEKLPGRRFARRLGIIFDEGGLLVSEIRAHPDGDTLSRTVRFVLTTGKTPSSPLDPLPQAAAFAEFLEHQGLTGRRVIFGLPARQLMLMRHELPPADQQTTASALWLHASSALPPEMGKTTFDFVGDSSDPHLQQITLVGLQSQFSERLRDFCRAAGLQPDCAMPTSFALAHATGRVDGNALILHRRETTAELMVQVDHLPRVLRSIPSTNLQSELRRAAAQLPASGATGAFVVWDDIAPDPVQDVLLAAAVGMPMTRPDANAMGLARYQNAADCNLKMAALFDAALSTDRPCINLFKPKVTEPRPPAVYRGRSLAMAGALALLMVLGACWLDLQRLATNAQRAQSQLDELQPEVRNAKPLIQRLEYLSAFTAAQPRYLACLRDLTESVEAIASVHLDHFDLNQAMQGNCAGEAAVEKDALDFVDRLNSSRRFSKVNCKLDTESSASQGEKVTFRIAFGYLPTN